MVVIERWQCSYHRWLSLKTINGKTQRLYPKNTYHPFPANDTVKITYFPYWYRLGKQKSWNHLLHTAAALPAAAAVNSQTTAVAVIACWSISDPACDLPSTSAVCLPWYDCYSDAMKHQKRTCLFICPTTPWLLRLVLVLRSLLALGNRRRLTISRTVRMHDCFHNCCTDQTQCIVD